MKRFLGAIVLLFGLAVGVWLVFDLLSFQMEGRGKNPVPAILFTAGAIYVGVKWLRGE